MTNICFTYKNNFIDIMTILDMNLHKNVQK